MGSDDNRPEPSSGPFWQVEFDAEECSLCEVCARWCPTGAIRSDATEGTLAILFNPELCDGCGICLARCPEDIMSLVRIELSPGVDKEQVLAKGEMLQCSVCGAQFAPQSKLEAATRRRGDDTELIREQCPLCRRTQMVAVFIDEKRQEARGRKAEYRTGMKWRWKPVSEGDPDGPPCPETLSGPSGDDRPD
jgi:Pyruvate/2-oxoacid:ferredoxin oxidoreductase delta subunit